MWIYFQKMLWHRAITMRMFLEQTARRKRRKSTFKVFTMFRASKNEELGQGRGKEKMHTLLRHSVSSDAHWIERNCNIHMFRRLTVTNKILKHRATSMCTWCIFRRRRHARVVSIMHFGVGSVEFGSHDIFTLCMHASKLPEVKGLVSELLVLRI